MNIKVFNLCLLLGWLMVLAGGVIVNPGWGIVGAGALLLVLTLATAYLAGIQAPKPGEAGEAKGG
jgi:hypothetical protein